MPGANDGLLYIDRMTAATRVAWATHRGPASLRFAAFVRPVERWRCCWR